MAEQENITTATASAATSTTAITPATNAGTTSVTSEPTSPAKPKRIKAKVKPGYVAGGRRKADVEAERKAQTEDKRKARSAEKRKNAQKGIKSSTSNETQLNETGRKLVHYMVWEGLRRKDAIKKLGKSESYGYTLLRSPAVLQHYRAELEVLRTSGAARTIHRLEEIADQGGNLTAAVQASKVLMGVGNGNQAPGVAVAVQITPGYVIDVSGALAAKAGHQLPQHTTPVLDAVVNQPVSEIRATVDASHGAISPPQTPSSTASPATSAPRIRRLAAPPDPPPAAGR